MQTRPFFTISNPRYYGIIFNGLVFGDQKFRFHCVLKNSLRCAKLNLEQVDRPQFGFMDCLIRVCLVLVKRPNLIAFFRETYIIARTEVTVILPYSISRAFLEEENMNHPKLGGKDPHVKLFFTAIIREILLLNLFCGQI